MSIAKLYPHDANAATAQDKIVSKCGGKWVMKKAYNNKTKKAHISKFKPGDIVTFDFGKCNGYRQHTGIIDHISGEYAICIEGNTSKKGSQSNGGMVCEQRRLYSSICAVARPAYKPGEAEKVVKVARSQIGYCESPAGSNKTKYGKLFGLNGEPWCSIFNWWCFQKASSGGATLEPLEVDGIMGYETITRLQRWLGVSEDGAIGRITTKALQKKIGMPKKEQDGEWGEKTTLALQRYLNTQGYGLVTNGKKDKATVKALQRYLNKVVTK